MCRQSQCSGGCSASSDLASSSLKREPVQLRIPIWIIIIIISVLQGIVSVSPLHISLHRSAGKRPLGYWRTHSCPCGAELPHLFCVVPLVHSSQGSRKCNVCWLSCLALNFDISSAGGQPWQRSGDKDVSSAFHRYMNSLFGTQRYWYRNRAWIGYLWQRGRSTQFYFTNGVEVIMLILNKQSITCHIMYYKAWCWLTYTPN